MRIIEQDICIDSVNIATVKAEHFKSISYFLGLLNSKLFIFIYRELSHESGRILAQVKPQRIKMLPIIVSNGNEKILISKKVTTISKLKLKNTKADTFIIESEIDLIVYKIYDLTYAEACIVEGNNEWMPKEAYENFTITY